MEARAHRQTPPLETMSRYLGLRLPRPAKLDNKKRYATSSIPPYTRLSDCRVVMILIP